MSSKRRFMSDRSSAKPSVRRVFKSVIRELLMRIPISTTSVDGTDAKAAVRICVAFLCCLSNLAQALNFVYIVFVGGSL